MNVDFDSKTVTLNLEDVKQLFKMSFSDTELGSFNIVMESEKPTDLWYPDDSGDWIEVSNSDTETPVPLDTFVFWLLETERDAKKFDPSHTTQLSDLRDSSGKYFPRVVAIKRV